MVDVKSQEFYCHRIAYECGTEVRYQFPCFGGFTTLQTYELECPVCRKTNSVIAGSQPKIIAP